MKKLSEFIEESKQSSVLYHLSYDIIGTNKDKPENPVEFILKVLKKLGATNIERHSESSLIITFDRLPNSIFKALNEKMSPFFYYSISKISKKSNNEFIIHNNGNKELNNNIKQAFKDIVVK